MLIVPPLPDLSPVQKALCTYCGDPGMCCREIRFYSGGDLMFAGAETKLEALVALAAFLHPDPWMHYTGLPFLPERRDKDGRWVLSCPHLTSEGRCDDYDGRPWLCRWHEPGNHWPCIMTKTPIGSDAP